MRLHAENPELSYEEVIDLAMRTGSRPFKEGEPRYEYECRQCGDSLWVDQEQHDKYQHNKEARAKDPYFIGSSQPKCGACWA